MTVTFLFPKVGGSRVFHSPSKKGHVCRIARSWLFFPLSFVRFREGTWRIIPGLVSVVNNHGNRKSPKDRVVGPLPNGHEHGL